MNIISFILFIIINHRNFIWIEIKIKDLSFHLFSSDHTLIQHCSCVTGTLLIYFQLWLSFKNMTSFAQLKTLPHLYVVSVVFTATCVLNKFFYVLFLGFFFFLWNAFINMLSLYKSTELYKVWGLYVIDKPVLSFATRNTYKTLVCSSVSRNVQNRTYFIL